MENKKGIIEALLFVADQALSLKKISDLAEVDTKTAREILDKLAEEYVGDSRGFQLRQVAGGYQLYTHPAYASYIEKLVLSSDYKRLTRAALETLAIIAYKQPVTRAEISTIRGVNVEAVLNSLLEKELVKVAGRMDTPGQPILYRTTKQFLEIFGINSVSDLPSLRDFAPDEETKKLIEEKLTTETNLKENASEASTIGSDEEVQRIAPSEQASELSQGT